MGGQSVGVKEGEKRCVRGGMRGVEWGGGGGGGGGRCVGTSVREKVSVGSR